MNEGNQKKRDERRVAQEKGLNMKRTERRENKGARQRIGYG